MRKRLFLVLIVQTGLSFLVSALFVILFFRIYPQKMFLIFPISFVLGILVGILSYLPFKSLVEKD